MDLMCQGLISGLPFRQDSWTVSGGPGLEAVALCLCPREVVYMHLVTGHVEASGEQMRTEGDEAAPRSWTASRDIELCPRVGLMGQGWILISKLSLIPSINSAETQWFDSSVNLA